MGGAIAWVSLSEWVRIGRSVTLQTWQVMWMLWQQTEPPQKQTSWFQADSIFCSLSVEQSESETHWLWMIFWAVSTFEKPNFTLTLHFISFYMYQSDWSPHLHHQFSIFLPPSTPPPPYKYSWTFMGVLTKARSYVSENIAIRSQVLFDYAMLCFPTTCNFHFQIVALGKRLS